TRRKTRRDSPASRHRARGVAACQDPTFPMSRLQGDLPRRARPGFIARPALVQAVAAGQARGLTVLAAPAGYGKTWLAGQVARRWSQGAPRRDGLCVWTLQGSTTILQALRSFCALFDEQDVPASLDTAG